MQINYNSILLKHKGWHPDPFSTCRREFRTLKTSTLYEAAKLTVDVAAFIIIAEIQ